MLNVFDVSETLVNHIKSHYPDDISIISYYGSYAQGTATQRSDLDFFFIPATSTGYNMSLQFVINDISFDFYPISWDRAERMASFENPQTTIIADSHLLYVRSDEDSARFMALRDKINDMRDAKHGLHFLNKAELQFRDVYVHLYKMKCADIVENILFFRTEAHGVLTKVIQGLALLNQTYFTRGWGKNMDQILQLPLKPARLESLINAIIYAKSPVEIQVACEQLTKDTLEILFFKKQEFSEGPSYPNRMKGFYEEVKGIFDKIITACERNDYYTAFYWSISVQDEIAHSLFFAKKGHTPSSLEISINYQDYYFSLGFPDLVSLMNNENLVPLHVAVERLDTLLENHLINQGVGINRFHNVKQFEEFLEDRSRT